MRSARRAWSLLACAALWACGALAIPPRPALAHDLKPGGLAFREVEPGRFTVRITPPQDGSGRPPALLPVVDGCSLEADGLRCGRRPSRVSVPTLAERRVKCVVAFTFLDGSRAEGLLREGESELTLGRSRSWLVLGVEHILGGFDHLLFVLGLALVARRRLLLAVTGFTVGHSVTLAAATLGAVAAPAGVELLIAASVVLLAAEALREQDTLTARAAPAIATAFGLLHGFGFASALAELGSAGWWPLLGFNLGVELGQLAVLGVALLAARSLVDAGLPQPRRLAAYAIGLPAGSFAVERAAAFLG